MGDTWLADISAEFEGKLIGLPRRCDFAGKSFENDLFIQANLNVNRNLFLELLTKERTGFFIYDLRVLLSSDNEPSVESAEPTSPPVKVSYGSMFVPLPNFSSLFLFKKISKVTADTQQNIAESLRNQLQLLNKHLESSVQVRLMLTFKNDKHKKLFLSIKKEVERVCSADGLNFINLDFKYCIDEKQKVEDFNCEPRPSDGLTKLMKKVFDSDQLTQNYTLSPRMYSYFGGESFTLTEHEKVMKIFHIYFPDFDGKLEMIPDWNRIKDNLLHSLKKDKKASFKEDESKYMGEVKWFLDKCIPMLQPMTGVLIKNWDYHLLNNLLSSKDQFKQNFEFDYLLCSKNNLVVFEVATTKKSESPETTVMNKIEQNVTKNLPTLKILTAAILEKIPDTWFTSPEDKKLKVQRFIRDNLKVIVYLPNATIRGYKTFIEHNKGIRQFMEKYKSSIEITGTLNQIFFVMHKHGTTGGDLVAFKLFSNLEVEEIGDPRLVVDIGPETAENIKLYLSALIAFSKLKCDDAITQPEKTPLDVDERYKESRSNTTILDIILSPQQVFTLNSETSPKVWLRGEPGSGKTALLLAKAFQLAEKPEITHIFYAIPSKMCFLKSTIETELLRKCQGNVEGPNKIQIVSFDDYNHLNRQMDHFRGPAKTVKRKIKYLMQPGNQAKTAALFIDEAYADVDTEKLINQFDQFGAKYVWVAEVVTNRSQKNWAERIKDFEVVNLTVLYRNSHHISQLASSLINSSGVAESTAVVHGCHTSSQREIAVEFFSNEEQLSQVARDMLDPRFENGRLLIYFTKSDDSESLSAACRRLKLDHANEDSVFIGNKTADKPPFAGCEKKSVVVVVDEYCDGISEETMILSITRAQYEVTVLINKQFPQIDNLLSYLRSAMPPHLRIYAKLKSGSNFTEPEPLATGDFEEVVEKLLERLTKEEWMKFIRSMPLERSKENGVTFVGKRDIIVEIVKEPHSTWELLEAILKQEAPDHEALDDINEILQLCKIPSKLSLGARNSKPQDSGGEFFRKVTQAIWRRYENDIIERLNYEGKTEVLTALAILKRYELLQEHLEKPGNLLLQLSKSGEASIVKQAFEVVAEEIDLQKHIEKMWGLFSDFIQYGKASNVKAVLEFLAEKNLLQNYLKNQGEEFFIPLFKNGKAGNVQAALQVLAEKNFLQNYLRNQEEEFFLQLFHYGDASNVRASLEVLAEKSLLQNVLENSGRFFIPLFEFGKEKNVQPALQVLAEENLLQNYLKNQGKEFFLQLFHYGDASYVKAALEVLAEKNLLQNYLKNQGENFFAHFFQYGNAGNVRTSLEVLAEKNLLQNYLKNQGEFLFFAHLFQYGDASKVRASLEVLAEKSLLQNVLENSGRVFIPLFGFGKEKNVQPALEVLAEKDLLQNQLKNKRENFISLLFQYGTASNAQAAWTFLAENNLL